MEPLVRLPRGIINLHDRYRRCALVNTREGADLLLNELAQDFRQREGCPIDVARAVERQNIGYWASAYLPDTEMRRVWYLFHTQSPIFGDEIPHWRPAFCAGLRLATERKGEPMLAEERAEIMFHTADVYFWRFPKKP